MKRDDKFQLVNELSKAVTDKTVYEHALGTERLEYHANTNTLKINGSVGIEKEEKKVDEKQVEEEIFAKLYEQRKS
ncbi:MAG: hypothetical protein II992_09205 [Lachnospiraceae bacterium]|nr:hypothetical protein [Lachnospiraceae bacterium]